MTEPAIPYGKKIWRTDSAAANAEAQRRACLLRDADDPEVRKAIYFHDLVALTELPQELVEIDGLAAVLCGLKGPGVRPVVSKKKLAVISTLAELNNLTHLDLSHTRVSDLSALRDMTALQSLDLRSTQVGDLSALRDMNKLQILKLSSTQVSDLAALRDMTALQSLDLSHTEVSDLVALRGMSTLQTLNLRFTQVSDLSGLRNMTALQKLYLIRTQVSDLSALRDMAALQHLDLRSTQVRDLSALRDLTALESLVLSDTRVSDLSVLLDLPRFAALQAHHLDFADTPISQSNGPWEMLAGLSAKRAARDVVLYRQGKHPDLQPPEDGGVALAGAAAMAAASPVALVEREGRAELADPTGVAAPAPLDPDVFTANIRGVHETAKGVLADLDLGANVPPVLTQRIRRYVHLSDPEARPVRNALDGVIVMIRASLEDNFLSEQLEAGVRAGLRHLCEAHDTLGAQPALPEILPDLPRLPETPDRQADAAALIQDAAEVIRQAGADQLVGPTVIVAIESTVDVATSVNTPSLAPPTPEEETQRKGLWSWALRMGGGLVQAMELYGKAYHWAQSPAGVALMQRLAPLVQRFLEYFSLAF